MVADGGAAGVDVTYRGVMPVLVGPDPQPASERAVLVSFVDHYRALFARKVEGLGPEQLARTTAASSLTLGGLWKHLALVEDDWFTMRLAGRPAPEPWASAPFDDDPDWELHSAGQDSPDALAALFDAACQRSRAVVASIGSLDALTVWSPRPDRGPWNLRWVLVHLIEEYARHVGHADLLREAVDGRTGD